MVHHEVGYVLKESLALVSEGRRHPTVVIIVLFMRLAPTSKVILVPCMSSLARETEMIKQLLCSRELVLESIMLFGCCLQLTQEMNIELGHQRAAVDDERHFGTL